MVYIYGLQCRNENGGGAAFIAPFFTICLQCKIQKKIQKSIVIFTNKSAIFCRINFFLTNLLLQCVHCPFDFICYVVVLNKYMYISSTYNWHEAMGGLLEGHRFDTCSITTFNWISQKTVSESLTNTFAQPLNKGEWSRVRY